MTLKTLFSVACIALALDCGGGKQPAQPSPAIEDPIVNCPIDIQVNSHSGQAPTVTFDTPVAVKGSAPVTVTCAPASGTEFSNGTTSVTCEAVDSRAHKASCNFSVSVTPIPQLAKTKFMAFGDSITEGKTSLIGPSLIIVPPSVFNTSSSYVESLNIKLTARYQDQVITLIAEGKGGEEAGQGKIRLRDVWPSFNPDGLLLQEGINDLLKPETATQAGMDSAIASVVDAMRADIDFAKSRGARVFVATLLPLTSPQPSNVIAAIGVVNAKIKTLIAQEGVTLVDLNAAIPSNMIGSDGLHPKAQAYDTMADEWLNALIAAFEIKNP